MNDNLNEYLFKMGKVFAKIALMNERIEEVLYRTEYQPTERDQLAQELKIFFEELHVMTRDAAKNLESPGV